MFQIFKEMNWSLLVTLIIVSAVVAWVGDVVAMRLGKKRITLFKLRPKYTSRIFSILTGIGIAIVTLSVVSLSSEPVRTALFSMNYVKNQITTLTEQLHQNKASLEGMEMDLFDSRGDLQEKQNELTSVENKLSEGTKKLAESQKQLMDMKKLRAETEKEQKKLQTENARLNSESRRLQSSVKNMKQESDRLKNGIQRLREGRIAVLTGEIMAQEVITQRITNKFQFEQVTSRLIEEGRTMLAFRFGKKPNDIKKPVIEEATEKEIYDKISSSGGRWLIRMTAQSNAVEGEPVEAELSAFSTKIVFHMNDVLAEKNFNGGEKRDAVEEELLRSLRDVNAHAVRQGVLRDPLSGNVGSIDTPEFMDIIDKIAESKTQNKLEILAAKDIYTEGPVRVKFRLR